MRKIKFRVWEKNLKEMIPVHNINFENKMVNTESAWRLFSEVELMQFTGLKDKNGKEIYEGDIVDVSYLGRKEVVKFFIHAGFACFMPFLDDGHHWNSYNCEVIGNIYENPELLQVKN